MASHANFHDDSITAIGANDTKLTGTTILQTSRQGCQMLDKKYGKYMFNL